MTVVVGLLLIAAVATAIAYPLLRPGSSEAESARQRGSDSERLKREKHIALLAIKEAEFDHAMGKLSESDYGSLRGIYEERALGALSALAEMGAGTPVDSSGGGRVSAPAQTGAPDAFCSGCGRRFEAGDRFCPGCGKQRGSVS